MLKIHKKAVKGLENLNRQQQKTEKSIVKNDDFPLGMYSNQCDEAYYRDVARFAWAYRAKTIAMLELQETINELKNKIKDEKDKS